MKNNIFMVILVLLVVGLGGYLVYDKIIAEDSNKNANVVEESNEEAKSNLLDLNKLRDIKNFDSTYGYQQTYIFENPNGNINEYYTVNVVLDGSVRICKGRAQECNNINNIKDVVDSKEFVSSSSDTSIYYFLTNNGDVYYYKSSNIINKDYKAVKLTDISKVNKLLYINYYPIQNAGGESVLIGITNDDDYVVLYS